MKQILTIKQSAELIKRGVNANRATEIKLYDDPVSEWTHRGCLLFTLTDLFSLLPVDIYQEHKVYGLAMRFIFEKWHVEYSRDNLDILAITHATELIDALYEMLLWWLDNNHVKLD